MDGAATMSEIRKTFRTPIRILLPKLLKSRDDWKAKSDARKVKLKSAQIKLRDTSASRDKWRERSVERAAEVSQLREETDRLRSALAAAEAVVKQFEDAKKN